MGRKICLMLVMVLLVPLGLMAPSQAATTPTWACPATQPVTVTFLGPWGADPTYMKNLCGQNPGAQPASWVKFSELDGNSAKIGTAFLGLPGAFAMDDQFGPLLDTIKTSVGKAVFANYAGVRFDAQNPSGAVVTTIRAKLRELLAVNDQVMVFGTSTGGPIASQVIAPLTDVEKAKITLELGCSPAGNATLSPSSQKLTDTVRFAQVLGEFGEFGPTRFFLLQVGGHADYGTQYQFDQALYNGGYQPLPNGALAGLKRVAYFAVTNDETVNDTAAFEVWKKMRGSDVPLYTLNGKHVDYASNPAEWNTALGVELALFTAPQAAQPAA